MEDVGGDDNGVYGLSVDVEVSQELHAAIEGCCFLSKMQIPHPISVVEWVCLFLKAYKRATPLLFKSHFSPPLKAICSIVQLFWVFTFCLNFLGN